ncbi:APC family permease [Oceanobacillus polygoni]|uniref:Amino acid transporter n=1 Tax=Oceanobacillus polygoni TaxID=1235259 RepID=A0A9X0YQF5_9BACI|nr:APC family permease [Oceanobacillus polygoni]MBP2076176.1 amino acid transporter [Oceanobacillus polygoni]
MNERTTLEKSLKPHWVWAIALGSAIGWGAFVQPATWMSTAGPLGVIIGFGIGGLLMMLIAVSYGFLIKSFPVSGGAFAYTYVSLGRTHAFICGWFLTFGYICIVALNASAFALMIKFTLPKLIENIYLYEVAGWSVYGTEIIIATIALIVFGYFNIKGTGMSGRIQFIFCCVMVISIVVLTLLVGIQPGTGISNMQPFFPVETTAFAAIISIVAIAPWAYVGFDTVPQTAEEFNFSSKKAFSLIIYAIFFAFLLYSLMIIATSMAEPWQGLVAGNYIWGTGTAIQRLLGIGGLAILVVALTMGIFTGLIGFILSSSRLLFAMSRAKILPEVFSNLHPKYKTPYIGIIFVVILSMFAPWFGREALLWVVDMSSVGVTIAYFYTCFTAFKLFKWKKDANFNGKLNTVSPSKKVVSFIGLLTSLVFLGLLLVPGSPAYLGVESRIALVAWVVLGVIFYLMKRKQFNKVPEKELNYLILGEEDVHLKK